MMVPLIDIRARIYDMAHDPLTRDVMTMEDERGHLPWLSNRRQRRRTSMPSAADGVCCRRQDRPPIFGQYHSRGDRSKRPQEQDPDFLVRVVKETDSFFSR